MDKCVAPRATLTARAFNASTQTWVCTENLVLESLRGVSCLVQIGTTVQFDNVVLEPAVLESLQHTANFVAAYAVGTAEYFKFLRAATPLLRRSRALSALQPIVNERGKPGIHLLTNDDGRCWVLRCESRRDHDAFQFHGITEESVETRDWLDCLSHYTFEKSLHRFVVEVTRVAPNGALVALRVHTNSSRDEGTEAWPFGIHNKGPSWIKVFTTNHKCNAFCTHLRLSPSRTFL
jgi:hypothetical protein